jgi:hypothetical protein
VSPGCQSETDDAIGTEQAGLGVSCRTDIAIGELNLDPAVLTPAGANGIFDSADIKAILLISPGVGACVLERRLFDFFAGWSLEVEASGGETVWTSAARRFLDFDGCGGPRIEIPLVFEWSGTDSSGAVVADGTYTIRLRAWVEMELKGGGLRPIVVRRATPGSRTVVVQSVATEEEVLLEERVTLKASLPLDDVGNPAAGLYDEVLAPKETLDRLAALGLELAGRTFDEEFALRSAAVTADPNVPSKPQPRQVGAWRAAFVASFGRLSVEWSPLGVPASIDGLDLGPQFLSEELAADEYLASFASLLGDLFRTEDGNQVGPAASALATGPDGARELAGGTEPAGGDGLVRESLGEAEDQTMANFGHWVTVQTPQGPVTYPVRGDLVTLHMRRSGKQDGLSPVRVLRLSARWTPDVPRIAAAIHGEVAGTIALSASGITDPEIIRSTEGPFFYPAHPTDIRLLFLVHVGNGVEARDMWIDATSGEVYRNQDVQMNRTRLDMAASPVRRQPAYPYPAASAYGAYPLRHTYVYDAGTNPDFSKPPGVAGRPTPLCATDGDGRIPLTCPGLTPGMRLQVALRGPTFEQWSPVQTVIEGGARFPVEPIWHSAPFTYAGPDTDLLVSGGSVSPPFYNDDDVMNVYYYLTYLRWLFDRYDDADPYDLDFFTYFRTSAAPDGYASATCSSDAQCGGCGVLGPAGYCDAYNFGHGTSEPSCPTGFETCASVHSEFCACQAGMCPVGTCSVDACGIGVSGFYTLWGDYSSSSTRSVRGVFMEPCVNRVRGANVPIDNNRELMAVSFHEYLHQLALNWRSTPDDDFGGGHMSEAMPEGGAKAPWIFIDDIRGCLAWANTRFGGDPLAGWDPVLRRPGCEGSPETDDPSDAFACDHPDTCTAVDPGPPANHRCYTFDASGRRRVPGGGVDWFFAILRNLALFEGSGQAFANYVGLFRAGISNATRVAGTTDSLFRKMTDRTLSRADGFEVGRAFRDVVKADRVGFVPIDDRTSLPGRGELVLPYKERSATGNLDHPQDHDWFIVPLAAGMAGTPFTIQVLPRNPWETDTYVMIWRLTPSGRLDFVGWNDDPSVDSVRLSGVAEDDQGPLLVRVAASGGATGTGRLGGYTLRVYSGTDDYPPALAGRGYPVAVNGGRIQGYLGGLDDDGFAFFLAAGAAADIRVDTPASLSGVQILVRREDEATARVIPRATAGSGMFRYFVSHFAWRETNAATEGKRYLITIRGIDAVRTPEYVLSLTQAVPAGGDICGALVSDTAADASCKIADLAIGAVEYRAGALQSAADRDSYWLQLAKGSEVSITVTSLPGRPRDGVEAILHAEGWEGELCGLGDPAFAIAATRSVASTNGDNAAELTFVVPADVVNPGPSYTSPAPGWYRLQLRPSTTRVVTYPLQYVLSVTKVGAGRSPLPEVE